MEIKEIKEKEIWESFLLDCDEKTFLSSWNWGEFQKMMGNKIWRLGIYNGGELFEAPAEGRRAVGGLESVALVVKMVAKRGTFLLVPHGPNNKIQNPKSKFQILESVLDELKKIAKGEKVDFIRISPIWQRNEENNEIFKKLGFKLAPIHIHPEASWKLDLRPSEEELLMGLRKTTRYLIRQAEKNKDIEIFQSPASTEASAGKQKIEDVEIFNRLYQKVVQLQHFVPFSLDYLRTEFLAFQPDNQISIFFGKYQGKIIASAFVIFWSKIGFYHHAALLPQYHKIPIAYSLLWEAVKEAKRRGCILYDFWGYVNPKENPKHPWAGPTLFKMGFGGTASEYLKTQDYPLSKKYWLISFFEKIRRMKRGL